MLRNGEGAGMIGERERRASDGERQENSDDPD
jgi:hypothetical protein